MMWPETERLAVRSIIGRNYARLAVVNLALLAIFAVCDGGLREYLQRLLLPQGPQQGSDRPGRHGAAWSPSLGLRVPRFRSCSSSFGSQPADQPVNSVYSLATPARARSASESAYFITCEEVRKVVDEPDDLQVAADEHSNNHYVRRFIRETPGQLSREALITVVVDPYKRPNKVVTVTVD